MSLGDDSERLALKTNDGDVIADEHAISYLVSQSALPKRVRRSQVCCCYFLPQSLDISKHICQVNKWLPRAADLADPDFRSLFRPMEGL
jgi:hypothetical protein